MHCALVLCAFGGERCRTLYERRRRRAQHAAAGDSGGGTDAPKVIQVRSGREHVERTTGEQVECKFSFVTRSTERACR
jgi:hypothetical protein